MSSDKRKRFNRACALLRELNQITRGADRISQSGNCRFSTKNPLVRYCLERGLARMERRRRGGMTRRTYLVVNVEVER